MPTDYERLNNAIVKASMRGGAFAKLAADWKDEVSDEQNWKIAIPPLWASTLKLYWGRYAELYGLDPRRCCASWRLAGAQGLVEAGDRHGPGRSPSRPGQGQRGFTGCEEQREHLCR